MRQRSICTGLHIIQTLLIISIPIHALLVMGTQQFKSHLQYILLNSDSNESTKGNYVCLSVCPFVRQYFFLLRMYFPPFPSPFFFFSTDQIFTSFSSSSACQICSSFSFYSADQIFPISKHFPSFSFSLVRGRVWPGLPVIFEQIVWVWISDIRISEKWPTICGNYFGYTTSISISICHVIITLWWSIYHHIKGILHQKIISSLWRFWPKHPNIFRAHLLANLVHQLDIIWWSW